MKRFLEQYFDARPVATPSGVRDYLWPLEPAPADTAPVEVKRWGTHKYRWSSARSMQYKIYIEMADRISASGGTLSPIRRP